MHAAQPLQLVETSVCISLHHVAYFHRLYIYDDLMYAYYPAKKLPVVDKEAKATFKNGIRFEVRDVNAVNVCGLQTLFK